MTGKEELRQRIWALLEERNVARFPLPVSGRIPNFKGAQEAAARLGQVDLWEDARAIKANPDSPQRWARRLALQQGKTVYMAVPRLTRVECFLQLNPKAIPRPDRAATIKGAFALGVLVRPEAVSQVDLVLAGSVAVNREGGRVGKGGGYSDIEYALGREFGFIREKTPVVTTVHPLQLVEDEIPAQVHDIPLDIWVTPEGVHTAKVKHRKPRGIYWEMLSAERIDQIPILQELRRKVKVD